MLMEDFWDPCPFLPFVCVKAPGSFSLFPCFPHPQPNTSLWLIIVGMKEGLPERCTGCQWNSA